MSYHEGSNWQARKEDEGKPLYENEKKAIPKQTEPSTGSEEDWIDSFMNRCYEAPKNAFGRWEKLKDELRSKLTLTQ